MLMSRAAVLTASQVVAQNHHNPREVAPFAPIWCLLGPETFNVENGAPAPVKRALRGSVIESTGTPRAACSGAPAGARSVPSRLLRWAGGGSHRLAVPGRGNSVFVGPPSRVL